MAQSKPCFDSLPDDMVIEIFSRLEPNKLLYIERVSRTWKRCVDKTLNRVELVAFGRTDDDRTNRCQHLRRADLTNTLVIVEREEDYVKRDYGISYRPFSTAQIDSMVRLLKRCPQVKCLSLEAEYSIEFKNVESLEKVLQALPQLECLRYGAFKIKKLIISEWLTLCQEFGPRLKHLTVDRNVKSKEIINSLITASFNLEFVFLEWDDTDKCHYLEALQNRDSIELSLDFFGTFEVDIEDEAIISRATNLTIQLAFLQSVGQHFPTFSRLKRLKIETSIAVVNEVIAMNFPALEQLNWQNRYNLDSASFAKHLTNYNLAGLKTLKIHQLDDDVLTTVADKLTSLEKLVLDNSAEHLPTDFLRLLSQRHVDLEVYYWFNSDEHFPKLVRLFEVVAEMTQLKRCRIYVTPAHFNSLNEHSNYFYLKLIQAYMNLRHSLPFVEFPIDNPCFNWWLKITSIIEVRCLMILTATNPCQVYQTTSLIHID